MAAAEYWSPNVIGGGFAGPGQAAEHLVGLRLTRNMLPMLGIEPLLGRIFAAPDEPKVVLSYGLWQRRFNRDPRVLGKAMTLNGEDYTVIGVMPPEFAFAPFWATRAELWIPLVFGERIHDREGNNLRVFARLKPDVTLAQARAEIAQITARLDRAEPGSNRACA